MHSDAIRKAAFISQLPHLSLYVLIKLTYNYITEFTKQSIKTKTELAEFTELSIKKINLP